MNQKKENDLFLKFLNTIDSNQNMENKAPQNVLLEHINELEKKFKINYDMIEKQEIEKRNKLSQKRRLTREKYLNDHENSYSFLVRSYREVISTPESPEPDSNNNFDNIIEEDKSDILDIANNTIVEKAKRFQFQDKNIEIGEFSNHQSTYFDTNNFEPKENEDYQDFANKYAEKNILLDNTVQETKEAEDIAFKDSNNHVRCLHLTITVKLNNMFMVLRDMNTNTILKSNSAEQLGFFVSKKKLNTVAPLYITRFFSELNFEDSFEGLEPQDFFVVKIKTHIKLRKRILKSVKDKFIYNSKSDFKAKSIFIEIPYVKCFNGCRGPKKLRSKKKGSLIEK